MLFKLRYIILSMLVFVSSNAFSSEERISELKEEILKISAENTSNLDAADEVKEILLPLVEELVSLVPQRQENEKLDQVIGAWKSVWSYRSFGFGTDYDQVYQVVSEDGYYYNISNVKFLGLPYTSYLRGEYKDSGDFLRINSQK